MVATGEMLKKFGVHTTEEFLSKFEVEDVSSLKVRRTELETGVKEGHAPRGVSSMRSMAWTGDIESRNARISKLEKDERELRERENELRHVKFLKGEVDGFISGYIIERKLFGSLKAVASQYLQNFTGGRYTIDQLIPTTRRVREREAHGLEITLNDNLDGMVKEREGLSGGDETALGLALRLAISRLMARIRPYKTSQQRPPLVTSLIMDEPLASLDGPRRQMVMATLFADKAFKQIFLITHTDVQLEGANVITLTQPSKDVRSVECSFGSAS